MLSVSLKFPKNPKFHSWNRVGSQEIPENPAPWGVVSQGAFVPCLFGEAIKLAGNKRLQTWDGLKKHPPVNPIILNKPIELTRNVIFY